jgi:hypothetical protein
VTVTHATVVMATPITSRVAGWLQRHVREERGVHELEVEGDEEGDDHRRELAVGVDAPPEPAEDEEQAGAGADLEQDLERLQRVLQPERDHGGQHHEQHVVTRPMSTSSRSSASGSTKRRQKSCTTYDAPQFRCVEMVDMYAAASDATTRPSSPGRQERQHRRVGQVVAEDAGDTCGNASWRESTVGNTTSDASATRIHGQGRSA